MIVLYDKEQCPFCWRVRMALHRLQVGFDRRPHDAVEWLDHWPTLTHFNTVPILVDGALTLTDSRTILEYLDEMYGELWPRDPVARAQAREVLAYADGTLGPAARDLIFERRDKPEAERSQQVLDDAIQRWRNALPALSQLLGDRDWFATSCGTADYAVMTRCALAFAHGMPQAGLDERLSRWLERMLGREEVVATAPGIVTRWLDER